MENAKTLTPRNFLRLSAFSPEEANAKYPNARRLTLGGLFVSHSGIDSRRIDDDIITPIVFRRLPADGFFMYSRGSGGESYRELVQAALHWCDKFMVVISEASIINEWVQAEVEWALKRSRPVLAVRFGACDWNDLVHMLRLPFKVKLRLKLKLYQVPCFDFSGDLKLAQKELAAALDDLLAKFPRQEEMFKPRHPSAP